MSKFLISLAVAALLCSSVVCTAQNVTADPLTGKPGMNIPLWTIHSGELSSAISLSYYGSPKVNDTEGTAGMGWNVTGGGAISRDVRGLPDDFIGYTTSGTNPRRGWLDGSIASSVGSFSPGSPNYSFCSVGEVANWSTLSGFQDYDTEPDMFYISAPGLSGQFLYDNSKVIQTVPYQDLKFDVSRNGTTGLIEQIVITNNLGVRYTFNSNTMVSRSSVAYKTTNPGVFNRDYYNYQKEISFCSEWRLTSITSPSNATLTFGYGSSSASVSPDYKMVVNETTGDIDTLFSIQSVTTRQKLATIAGDNEIATFTWTGEVLSSVAVKDRTYQSITKTFNLSYHYIASSPLTYPVKARVKRAFLSGLSEAVDCDAYPGYGFTYHGVDFTTNTAPMAFNSYKGQDMFGYYNSTATSLVPDVYVHNSDAGTNGDRYRIAPATDYSLMVSASLNRVVDATKVYYGSLKTIKLPSGGTTTVAYESAAYYDPLTGTSINGGGPRVKSITVDFDNSPAVVTTYKYLTSAGASSGQWTYRPVFVAFDNSHSPVRVPVNLAPEESLLYSRVEVSTSGKGKTVYEFQNYGMFPDATANGDFAATVSHMARPTTSPCESLGSLKSQTYTFPYAPNTNYDFERGLPTRVTELTRAGKIVRRSLYSYQRTSLTASSIGAVRLEQLGDIFQFGKYTVLANVNKVTATETTRLYSQADSSYVESVKTYTYNTNQMLSQVATTGSDNVSLATYYKYAKDYAGTGTDTQSSMINNLVTNNQHATLIESYTKRGAVVTGAQLTLFNNNYAYGTMVLPMQQLLLGDTSGFVPSYVSGSTFHKASGYYTSAYIDAYDALSHPIVLRDQSRMVQSSMMGMMGVAAILDIGNARFDEVAFTDFEPGGFMTQAVSSAGTTSTSSWAGRYSTSLTSAGNIAQSSVVKGRGKNYRFSCWTKAASAGTLTILINNTSYGTVSYSGSGAWQYVETVIDMSAVTTGATFSFKVTSSGTVSIDNLVYYPQTASVAAHAYEPLNGKTADLDSRGASAFQEYDALGRLHFVRNMDKDIVQIKDYHFAADNGILPVSSFTGNTNPNMGTSTTYTANTSCSGGVSYLWTMYDASGTAVQTSTSSTITYTFNSYETYRLSLTASATYGSTATEMVINPRPVLSAAINASGPTPISAQYCDTDATYTLSLTLTGCASEVTYYWYKMYGGIGTQYPIDTTATITYVNSGSGVTTTIYCKIVSVCTNPTTGAKEYLTTTVSRDFTCRDRSGGQ